MYTYLNKLIKKQNLSLKESEDLLELMTSSDADAHLTSAILTALTSKGETKEEIAGFIKGMRKKMITINGLSAIDIVGTGGDGSGTFNISTTSSFVVAGAGVKVAKHGNRAASSICGSADVLEALGVNIMLDPKKAETVLEKVGLVFLFAPNFHPAMKQVVPIRKALKIRTIFNFLGPFLNPAQVKRAVIGVPTPEMAKTLSEVAKLLNPKHLLIISSHDGMDEISTSGKTTSYEVKGNIVKKIIIDPQKLGFKKSSVKDLVGGDPKISAQILLDILKGKKGPKTDAVLINSAFALLVSGKVKNAKDGLKLAKESIESGKALQVLENLIKETNRHE